MHQFGSQAEWTDIDTIYVSPEPYKERSYFIENDWSAASYWYEMMALSQHENDEVRLEGLMDASRQGDSSVRYLFSLLGVRTSFRDKDSGRPTTVTLRKNGHCVPRLDYDFVNAPDLAQTIVVTCCALGVPFHFRGLQTLKIKETDRITALKREMSKLGYVLRDIDGCELVWDGERCDPVSPPVAIATYDDHRMALAFAPLALRQPIIIENPLVVTKSYPNFWEDLRQAQFTVHSS